MVNLKAYPERVKTFEKFLEKTNSRTQKELLQEAINYSNMSVRVFMKFSEAAQVFKETYIEFIDDTDASINQNIKKFQDLVNSSKELEKEEKLEEFRKRNLSLLLLALKSSQVSLDVKMAEIDLHFQAFQMITLSLPTLLFDYIFKPDEKEFKVQILKKILFELISKVEISGISTTIKLIYDSMTWEKQMANTSDKFSQYLENYIDSLKFWCILTEYCIRLYSDRNYFKK